MGSVAQVVIGHAKCPGLVVKKQQEIAARYQQLLGDRR
jgi:hypothetical protein